MFSSGFLEEPVLAEYRSERVLTKGLLLMIFDDSKSFSLVPDHWFEPLRWNMSFCFKELTVLTLEVVSTKSNDATELWSLSICCRRFAIACRRCESNSTGWFKLETFGGIGLGCLRIGLGIVLRNAGGTGTYAGNAGGAQGDAGGAQGGAGGAQGGAGGAQGGAAGAHGGGG